MSENTFNEAPASVSIKAISPAGFDTLLTIRDADTGQLMERTLGALEWLASKGFQPTGRAGNASNGNGQADSQICPIHQVKMGKRTGQGGDVWYSHKAVNPDSGAEFWCRGQEKK